MWNCSSPPSLLLPFSDDYVKCEVSNSPAGTVGFDKMLATDYDLCHHMSFSPSFQSLQSPTLFSTRSSERNLEIGQSSIYNGDVRPAFTQFSYTQPTTATHLVKWTAAGEPMTGDGSSFRGTKRLKKTATATSEGPQHRPQCSAKPINQPMKAPCKRSQKLGDKITALQQLVSPYGKTDTASVLHEAATCIRHLHEQIQILTAPYPGISSSASQQDTGDEEGVADLRRRGLCLAPLSPAIVNLVSETVRSHRH